MKLPHSVCEVLRDHVVLESECTEDRCVRGAAQALAGLLAEPPAMLASDSTAVARGKGHEGGASP